MSSFVLAWLPLLALSGAAGALAIRERLGALRVWAAAIQGALLALALLVLVATADGTVLAHRLGGWPPPVGIPFVADRMAALFLLLMVAVGAIGCLAFFLHEEEKSRSRSLALVFFLQAGLVGAVLTGDVFDFYVFFELMSVASYGLVAYRGTGAHLEAGFKYAALSMLGSLLMLTGIGGLYLQTGTLTLAAYPEASAAAASVPLYLFSLTLTLVSLCLKAAIFPFHFWIPDAHSIAPTYVSVLLSGAVVKVGAYGVLRILTNQAPFVWQSLGPYLLALAAITGLGAAWVAAGQRDLKRLLAYSTSSQMGYVLAAAAVGTAAGVRGALTHALAHGITKATLFVVAGVALTATSSGRWDRMGGLVGASSLYGAAALLACLSLAGFPPLAGFAGKLAVFWGLVEAGAWRTVLALFGASVVMVIAMFRVWLGGFAAPAAERRAVSRGEVATCAALGLAVVGVGMATGLLLDAAGAAAAQLLDGAAYREAVLGP